MINGVTLDQIKTFIVAAEEGNFSAAGRRLLRVPSVVSQTISNLEEQLDVVLFDRTKRYPTLTPAGDVLLQDARAIMDRLLAFKARANGMSKGLEAELSVVVDVMFPMTAVAEVANAFAGEFPTTPLKLYVAVLGAVADRVIRNECSIGIIGTLPDAHEPLRAERICAIKMVGVASPDHPLSSLGRMITRAEMAEHTQIILTDYTKLSEGRNFGVRSSKVWKLSDLNVKRLFLLAGLGFGGMPMHAIENDLALGTLVKLALEDVPTDGAILPMSVIYSPETPPGPAGRWFIDALRHHSSIYEPGIDIPMTPME